MHSDGGKHIRTDRLNVLKLVKNRKNISLRSVMKGNMTGLEVRIRISRAASDLHAAGARYHLNWRLRFISDKI